MSKTERGDDPMNDPTEGLSDPLEPPVGFTADDIQSFIDRIRKGAGRRHYLAARRPEEHDGRSCD